MGADIIGYPLEAVRRLISVALTVAVSPLVLLVHVAFKLNDALTDSILKQQQQSLFKGKRNNTEYKDAEDQVPCSALTRPRTSYLKLFTSALAVWER